MPIPIAITAITTILGLEPIKGLLREIPNLLSDRKDRVKFGEILARRAEARVRIRRDYLKTRLEQLQREDQQEMVLTNITFILEQTALFLTEVHGDLDEIGDVLRGADDDIPVTR